jgi:hypothetical protein
MISRFKDSLFRRWHEIRLSLLYEENLWLLHEIFKERTKIQAADSLKWDAVTTHILEHIICFKQINLISHSCIIHAFTLSL